MSLIKDIIVYAILGAIQGFSEPIPISSSGHLVLFQSIFEKLGLMVPQMNDVTFEVIVILVHSLLSCFIIAKILFV